MKYIGAHVDSTPTLARAPEMAAALGANAFALNLVDPSRWKSAPYTEEEIEAFRAACEAGGFTAAQILPHAGFVINLCSPDARKLKLSELALADEMSRAASLGLSMVNFHPGAHLKSCTGDECLERIAQTLDKVLAATPESVTAVIENTAGQGTNVGYTFEQIGRIISASAHRERIGVCVDTAHAFAAGYDMATPEGYAAMWADFDEHIGAHKLRGMHLNDSQRPLGSRIDRHAPIGSGTIGPEAFRLLMLDPRTDGIPLILETPDAALWQQEVATLRHWALESP